MSKVKFEWNGLDDAETPRARMVLMYGVSGKRVDTLETYRIKGRLLYRRRRSTGATLKILSNATREYDGGVFTKRLEATQAAEPGRREKCWMVGYDGSVTEHRIVKNGNVYDLEGERVRFFGSANVMTYKHRRQALKVARERLTKSAAAKAAELKALRSRIRRLK